VNKTTHPHHIRCWVDFPTCPSETFKQFLLVVAAGNYLGTIVESTNAGVLTSTITEMIKVRIANLAKTPASQQELFAKPEFENRVSGPALRRSSAKTA